MDPDCQQRPWSLQLAAHLEAVICEPIELRSGEVVQVGASSGSAFAMPGRMTADELVEAADAELYRAKEARAHR